MPDHDATLQHTSIGPPSLSAPPAHDDELGDLLQPTLRGRPARDRSARKPWRLGSIVYVAFFGGALASGAVALLNARRLGLAARAQAAIAALSVAGFAGAVVAAAVVGASADAGSGVRFAARVAALAAYGGMYLLMRSADRVHHFHEPDEERAYASLWIPGLLATLTFGLAETVAVYAAAGGFE